MCTSGSRLRFWLVACCFWNPFTKGTQTMQSVVTPANQPAAQSRPRKLQVLGILSGFTAGAWLGAAEAPTKLVSVGVSPIVISLIMVAGVFLARWSVPALILGTSSVRADLRPAPHLIIWALLAGLA